MKFKDRIVSEITKKPKRFIPTWQGIVIILALVIFMIILIAYTFVDEYTFGTVFIRYEKFMHSPPSMSRIELLCLLVIVIVALRFIYPILPNVIFIAPGDKFAERRITRKTYISTDFKGKDLYIKLIDGTTIIVDKRRCWKYYNTIHIMGEYKALKNGDEMIIEGPDAEITTESWKDKQIELLEKENSLLKKRLYALHYAQMGYTQEQIVKKIEEVGENE